MKVNINQLRKSFNNCLVLNIPKHSFCHGDSILFTGANGAGKTTLLRILGNLILPDEGTIETDEITCSSYYEAGFLQFGELTVSEHFSFCESLLGKPLDSRLFESFQLSTVSNQYVATLSRGWRARLGLALAFARNPQLLLLDEPLDALDEDGQKVFFEAITSFQQEREGIVCIATHRKEAYRQNNFKSIYFKAGKPLEVTP